MSDIVRGIVDFAHLTWGTTICVTVKFDRGTVDVSGACYIYVVFSTFSYECM